MLGWLVTQVTLLLDLKLLVVAQILVVMGREQQRGAVHVAQDLGLAGARAFGDPAILLATLEERLRMEGDEATLTEARATAARIAGALQNSTSALKPHFESTWAHLL